MTNPDFSPEALQRQQELNELQRLQAENARLEADKAVLVQALERIQALSPMAYNAIRPAGVDIIDEIRIAARDALARVKEAPCPNHPASIRAERLGKEADWLANRLACIQSQGDIEPETRDRSTEEWREAARKVVEES